MLALDYNLNFRRGDYETCKYGAVSSPPPTPESILHGHNLPHLTVALFCYQC